MTVRAPAYLDTSNTFITYVYSANSTQMDSIYNYAAYRYTTSTAVELSVVSSGGNLGNMTDRRKQAGDAGSNTGAGQTFPTEAVTDDISNIDTTSATISQTVNVTNEPTYTDENYAFPAYVTSSGHIRSMTKADFYDTFIYPTITRMTAGGSGADASRTGTYIISTLSSITGAQLVSATPVFTDTRASSTAYTAAGIPENNDQQVDINDYYLHQIVQVQLAPAEIPIYIDESTGDIRQYSTTAWRNMLRDHLKYVASSVTPYRIRYNINGGGNNCGTGMADTYLSGTSAQGYTTRFDAATTTYYAQEFPNGTPATRVTYYLRITAD